MFHNNTLQQILIGTVNKELTDLKKKLLQQSILNQQHMHDFYERLQKNITLRSQFLVQEICKVHTKQFLTQEMFQDFRAKNTFYKSNISKEVEKKFAQPQFLQKKDERNLIEFNILDRLLLLIPIIKTLRANMLIDKLFAELREQWLTWLQQVESYYIAELQRFKSQLKQLEVR